MDNTHIVYGLHAVLALLKNEPESVMTLWLEHARRDKRVEDLLHTARQADISIQRVTKEELDKLTHNERHQGVVAQSSQVPVLDEASLKPLLASLDVPPLLLILDGVQDPHNLGACLRTADAAGVHAVIAPRDRACGLTATVRKVACGAAETVAFIRVTNLVRCLRTLKDAGVWLYGADATASTTLYEVDFTGPVGLILGAEGQGMRRLTRESCDGLLKLPMQGSVESLNVSVAAGVCLYEALRQRSLAG